MWKQIFDNYEVTVALASLFIAVIATVFSGYQATLSRQHNRLAIRPYLVIHRTIGLEGQDYIAQIAVRNAGLGPAIIKKYQVSFDGKVIGTGDEPMTCFESIGQLTQYLSFSASCGRMILPNDTVLAPQMMVKTIVFESGGVTNASREELFEFIQRFGIDIEYTSLYREKFRAGILKANRRVNADRQKIFEDCEAQLARAPHPGQPNAPADVVF